MKLTDSLQMVKGVGPKIAAQLASMGLYTIHDFIDYWPRRYDDYTQITHIRNLKPGLVSIKGTFSNISARYSRAGLHMTTAVFSDDTSSVQLVWFNQPYRAKGLDTTKTYFIRGEFAYKSGRLNIVNPSVELASEKQDNGKIVSVYKESKHISSLQLRKIAIQITPLFKQIRETLPDWILSEHELVSRSEALHQLHLPASQKMLEAAKHRLSFEEMFHMQLAGELARRELDTFFAPVIQFDETVAKNFVANLSFKLTPDQKRSVWQIYKDMAKPGPMNRLIEGDVGSGKTAVAAMAALMAIHQGYQVLLMAPTEILARQHANTMTNLLAHTEYATSIGLLVGSLTKKQKNTLHTSIREGHCRLAIGTNALIQDNVVTDNVGLVIIDEQHRFGVEQRSKLRSKTGQMPHVLCMTATPIPRSLALTLYGELDITQLKSKPVGRSPVVTEIIEPTNREKLYTAFEAALQNGRQVFIVCPRIEDTESSALSSVESVYGRIIKRFPKRHVEQLHGGMKAVDKDSVMTRFKAGEIDILVTTTVIEVGVDVPNASVMAIEGAERFGLAQAHQLRGRVGRGEHQGYCYLVPSDEIGTTKRLRILSQVTDGFRLSELDLELRGAGAIYGTRQSGVLDLRITEMTDEALIVATKKAAEEFVLKGEKMVQYPLIAEKVTHFRSIAHLN